MRRCGRGCVKQGSSHAQRDGTAVADPAPREDPTMASAQQKVTRRTTRRRSTQGAPLPGEAAEPRLPHERDESADEQLQQPSAVSKQAKQDLDRGLVDTDRGPVLDDVYRRQRRRSAPK
jgi:hypothetical protein